MKWKTFFRPQDKETSREGEAREKDYLLINFNVSMTLSGRWKIKNRKDFPSSVRIRKHQGFGRGKSYL